MLHAMHSRPGALLLVRGVRGGGVWAVRAVCCKLSEVGVRCLKVAVRGKKDFVIEAWYEKRWSGSEGKLGSVTGGLFIGSSNETLILLQFRQEVILPLNSDGSRVCENCVTSGMSASLGSPSIVYGSIVKMRVAVHFLEVQKPRG